MLRTEIETRMADIEHRMDALKRRFTLDEVAEEFDVDLTALTITDWVTEVGRANAANGWHRPHPNDDPTYITARLALLTTEVAEAIEEVRNGHRANHTYSAEGYTYGPAASGDYCWWEYDEGTLSEDRVRPTDPIKPEGVPSELADVVIRAFDFAYEFGIPLEEIIRLKAEYNKTRGRRHGGKTL